MTIARVRPALGIAREGVGRRMQRNRFLSSVRALVSSGRGAAHPGHRARASTYSPAGTTQGDGSESPPSPSDEPAAGTSNRAEDSFRSLLKLSTDWYWEQDQHFRFTHNVGFSDRPDLRADDYVGKTRWQ